MPLTPWRRPHRPGRLQSFLLLLDSGSHPGKWERPRPGPVHRSPLTECQPHVRAPSLLCSASVGSRVQAAVSECGSAPAGRTQETLGRDLLRSVRSAGSALHILDQRPCGSRGVPWLRRPCTSYPVSPKAPVAARSLSAAPADTQTTGNTAWHQVPTLLGPSCLPAKPPPFPGPTFSRSQPHWLAGTSVPRPRCTTLELGPICGPQSVCPGSWSPPPPAQEGASARGGGGPLSFSLSPALRAVSPRAPAGSLGATSPTEGGHRNPGLPGEELVGLTAPGEVRQGWDAPQSVSHGPPDSSPCRSVQSSAVSWRPLPVYTALGFVKILTLLGGKWKKPDETLLSLAMGHVRGSKCNLPACSGPRLMTTPGREGRSPARACGKHSEIRESAGRVRAM